MMGRAIVVWVGILAACGEPSEAPPEVVADILHEARSGALLANVAVTLRRVPE